MAGLLFKIVWAVTSESSRLAEIAELVIVGGVLVFLFYVSRLFVRGLKKGVFLVEACLKIVGLLLAGAVGLLFYLD